MTEINKEEFLKSIRKLPCFDLFIMKLIIRSKHQIKRPNNKTPHLQQYIVFNKAEFPEFFGTANNAIHPLLSVPDCFKQHPALARLYFCDSIHWCVEEKSEHIEAFVHTKLTALIQDIGIEDLNH